MKDHMRGILIDPIAKTVTEVEHNGDYRQIYQHLSDPANGVKCGTFTIVVLDKRQGVENTLYVDDEGLLHDPKYFFKFEGYHPLANRGLILGTRRSGKSADATMTLDEVKKRVTFGQMSVQGFESYTGTTDHPILGPNTPVFGSYPVFGPPKED